MFHAISAWLARHVWQIVSAGATRDNAIAAAHGWLARQIKPGIWSYRDPRFIYRIFEHTHQSTGCTWCDGKIAEWLYFANFGTSDLTGQARRWS